MTTDHPTFFDRALLASELSDAQRSLSSALDAISHWTTPRAIADELLLEHLLADVRYHAHTVRTVQRLLAAQME